MAGFFYNLKSSLHFVCFIYREITMSDSTIQINTLEELVARIPKDRQSMIHCAVQRMGDTYKHHFILLGHTWSRYHEVCFIIHYTLVQGKRCIAKVMMQKIEEHQLQEYINKKLYVFVSEKYPKNVEEFNIAYNRFEKIVNEENFHIFKNNFEHLVSFILTGAHVCKQIEKLPWIRRCGLLYFNSSCCLNESYACSAFSDTSSASISSPFCWSFAHRRGLNLPTSTSDSVIKLGRVLPPSFPQVLGERNQPH